MKALPKWIITLIVFVVLSLVTGCGGHSVSTQPPANSTLRFVQTNATAGVVDVFVDNTLLRGSVPYLSDTGYLPLPAGAHQFSVQTVGASVPFVSSQITLAAGSANSFILSGWGPI